MFCACQYCPRDAAAGETVVVGPPAGQQGPRTSLNESLPPQDALEMLRAGNLRHLSAESESPRAQAAHHQQWRNALYTDGQRPAAVVIGCADSRCPVEILFDAQPGDIFVLRNAGNTCKHAEGSMVGSVEYAVGHLETKLVVILGHTKCGAIAGATGRMVAKRGKDGEKPKPAAQDQQTKLDTLLEGLEPVAAKAADELPSEASTEEIAAHAVKVNVFNTMDQLMAFSELIREKVKLGDIELHGAVYNLGSGEVEFLERRPGGDC